MHDCEHNQAHHPIRNFEKRKNLGSDLDHQPADHRVRDRDFVNVAPLQLGEEIALARSLRSLAKLLETRIFAERVPERIVF